MSEGALASGLYRGTIRHRRFEPVTNRFRYGVFQLLLDLDELPRLDREVRGFTYNRAGPISYHDVDHMGPDDRSTREKLADWLGSVGHELGTGRVLLLTSPRVLGYVFNPVSYFFCLSEDGAPRFTVAEVNNTFGETYCYFLDRQTAAGGEAVKTRTDKVFHVSPFMPIEGLRYEWTLTPPGERLTIHIDEFEDDRKFFDATLALAREPLTSGSLWRAIARYPHLTARTIWLIHWQALRLWLKRAPFYRKPEPPPNGLETA
ncbi:MAG: DUF1365 domain-containing protein [Gemmatimonadota bacterium]|nr:DUF1365 domain-containing protein [Gemmatimonadota bacterium]